MSTERRPVNPPRAAPGDRGAHPATPLLGSGRRGARPQRGPPERRRDPAGEEPAPAEDDLRRHRRDLLEGRTRGSLRRAGPGPAGRRDRVDGHRGVPRRRPGDPPSARARPCGDRRRLPGEGDRARAMGAGPGAQARGARQRRLRGRPGQLREHRVRPRCPGEPPLEMAPRRELRGDRVRHHPGHRLERQLDLDEQLQPGSSGAGGTGPLSPSSSATASPT